MFVVVIVHNRTSFIGCLTVVDHLKLVYMEEGEPQVGEVTRLGGIARLSR